MTKTLTEQQIRKIIENVTGKAAKVCKQKFYDKPKSLTEQWREGTLESGWYYTKHDDGKIYIWLCFKDDCSYIENPEVKEILAPVPSYKDYKKLRKLPLKCFQLEEDNSALMVINKDMCKEIERLQKQLKEANEVIKTTNRVSGNIDLSQLVYEDRRKVDGITMQTGSYLEKWGVK